MKLLHYSLALCVVALTACLIVGGFCVYPHVTGLLDAWKAAAPDLKPTLDAISGPRGTLHEVNKTVVKIGDAVVMTQIQQRKIAPHVIASVDSLASIAPHVNPVLDTANGTLLGATDALAEGRRTIEAFRPILGHSDEVIRHFDTLVTSPDLTAALSNVQYTTQNVAGVTLDLRKVSDKAAADYLSPKPWYRKIGRFAGDAFDYGALFARHY